MNPETMKNTIQVILEGLEVLALKLKVPVEFLWSLALKQVYVELFTVIIGSAILGVLIFLWVKLLKYGLGKEENEVNNRFYNNDEITITIFISGAMLIIFFTIAVISIIDIVPVALINPQWKALEILMKMIK